MARISLRMVSGTGEPHKLRSALDIGDVKLPVSVPPHGVRPSLMEATELYSAGEASGSSGRRPAGHRWPAVLTCPLKWENSGHDRGPDLRIVLRSVDFSVTAFSFRLRNT